MLQKKKFILVHNSEEFILAEFFSIKLFVILNRRRNFRMLKLEFFLKKKLGFTPCKAEQPLQGMELQEKEAQKD